MCIYKKSNLYDKPISEIRNKFTTYWLECINDKPQKLIAKINTKRGVRNVDLFYDSIYFIDDTIENGEKQLALLIRNHSKIIIFDKNKYVLNKRCRLFYDDDTEVILDEIYYYGGNSNRYVCTFKCK